MRRLRMLDTLNQYCQAILYYDQVADASFVRRFFHPTNEDLNVSNWSSSGRTYFYVTNATLNDDSGMQNHVIEDEPISSEDSSTSDDDVMKRHSVLKRISSSAMSLASTGWSSRSTLNITSPIEPEVYVAVEDHVTDVDDRRQNVMSLSVGEKVEVYTKSDTGWWFVKKEGSDVTKEFGYVPASYLVPAADFGEKSEITQMPTAYKVTNQRQFRDLAKSESSFVSEPSLANLHSHQPIRASGSLGSAYQLTSPYSGDKNNNIKRKPSSDFISVRAHTAQGPDELSFGENAILKILKVNEDGWWLARYKDKDGLVPGVHLRRYNDPIRRLSMEVLNFA
ncbi:SH3 and PX domain-containing protein 2A-like [Ciona intestinalis]